MQLQLIDHLVADIDDRNVLRRVDAPEAAREYILGGLAEQRRLVLVAAARGQRAVDQRVARLGVLDEKHDVRHRVEDRLQQREMREHATEGGVGCVERVSQRVHLACPVHPVR
jgi:hypothetical protein